MIGIDNSPLAIKVCEKRGLKDARVLSIDDIEGLKSTPFDTILMLGNNFGLLGSPEKAKILLRKLYSITTPQAFLIAATRDPGVAENSTHIGYQESNKSRGRLPGQIRMRARFKEHIGDWFDFLFISKNEMREILRGTGWTVQLILESKDSVYIAVIEKN